MKHFHKQSGIEFEVGYYNDTDGSTYDVTIITRMNDEPLVGDLSPITFVNYYFGEYDPTLTDEYIDDWMKRVTKEREAFQGGAHFCDAYLITNEDVMEPAEIEPLRDTIRELNKLSYNRDLLLMGTYARKRKELLDFKRFVAGLLGPDATEEQIVKLYDSKITLTIAGRSIELDFDAENYNNVDNLLLKAIENF